MFPKNQKSEKLTSHVFKEPKIKKLTSHVSKEPKIKKFTSHGFQRTENQTRATQSVAYPLA
jgi:hypothetical protein